MLSRGSDPLCKMGYEGRQVLQSMAQRWELDRKDIKAKKEVLTELSMLHRLFEPSIGCCHDSHVDP